MGYRSRSVGFIRLLQRLSNGFLGLERCNYVGILSQGMQGPLKMQMGSQGLSTESIVVLLCVHAVC